MGPHMAEPSTTKASAHLQDVERRDVGRAEVDLLLQDDVGIGLQQPLVAHHLPQVPGSVTPTAAQASL